VWEAHWSEQVAKQAVWLSGLVTFEVAEEILQRIGQMAISDSSIWRRVSVWGTRGQAVEAVRQASASALPTRSELVAGEAQPPREMGVAMDGGMVHVRQEGWKELKVGCVFDVQVQPTYNRETGETLDLAHAVRNTYVAHLGGPAVLGQLLWAEARQRHWMHARDTIALGDGATWVWNLVADQFYTSRQAVDWYHATQHLAHAAHVLKGEGTPAAQRWFSHRKTRLFQGHADHIAAELTKAVATHSSGADDLRREAGYFADHQHRMQYQELREDGFPVGSGMVESACKQFRARLAGPGMRWSRPGVERLLPIRAAIMSRRFDELWQAVYKPPLN
jgi:hypothetical protein